MIALVFCIVLPLFLAFGMNEGTNASAEWFCYYAFLTSIPAFVLGIWRPIPSAFWLFGIGLIWATWMIVEALKIHPFPFFLFLAPHFWPTYLTISGGLCYLGIERLERSKALEESA